MSQTTSNNSEALESVSDDNIGDAFDAAFDAWEPGSEETVEEQEAAPDEAAAETEETEESGEEETSEAVTDDGDEPPAEQEDETTGDPESLETDPESLSIDEPPPDFNAEEIEAFATLPEEAKKLLVGYAQRSQASRSELSNKYDLLEKSVGSVADTMKPYEPYLQNAGVTADQVIGGMMPHYANLAFGNQAQKQNTLALLGQSFGVEMNAPQSPTDEYVGPLTQQNNDRIAALEQSAQQDAIARQQAADAENQNQVNAFAESKDAKGVLKYPHFETVRETMGALMYPPNNGAPLARTMEEAYAKAITLNPQIQEAAKADAARAKLAADTKKAKAAKKDSAVNKKARTAPVKNAGPMSIGDAFDDAYESYGT